MTKRSRISLIGAAMMTTLLLCACAADSARSDLEKGRALSASGQLSEAYQTLQRSSAEHPGNSDLHKAADAARERYGDFLGQKAEGAFADRRYDEAAELFRQLVAVPGFESRGQDGLTRVAQRPASIVSQPVVPPVPLSVVQPTHTVARTIVAQTKGPAATSSKAKSRRRGGKTAEGEQAAALVSGPSAAPALSEPVAAQSGAASATVPTYGEPKLASLAVSEGPLDRRVTLEFRDASVRSLFDAITKASGLNVIFDRDISPDLTTTVYLRNTTVRAAIDKIVLTSGLAWRMLDENTLIVYTDETNKQHDYQGLVVRSFQLSNAEAKFVANSLKTVLKFRDLVVDEKLNMIVVRDTPESIALAEKLIAIHDVPEPEVLLEVKILEVTKNRLQSLGVVWPTTMTLAPLARTVSGTSTTTTTTTSTTTTDSSNTLTLRDLFNLTPGSLTTTISDTTVNVSAEDDDVKMLANPRIRTKNREKAKILIGERVPNISASTTSSGTVNQNITYVDVGLKLDVEPQIYPGNEIGLKISLEVSNINSTVTNTASGLVAYRIGTRNANTVLRLKDGENQLLGGLIQDVDKKTVNKVPLLGDLPLLGKLFRSESTEKDKTEIVLSITPKLVRGNNVMTPGANRFDAGTFSSVRGRRGEGDTGGGSVTTNGDSPSSGNSQQGSQGNQGNGGDGSNSQRQTTTDSSARNYGGSRD